MAKYTSIHDHKAIVYIHTTNDVSVFISQHFNRQCRICIQSFYLSILIRIFNTTCISIHPSNWCIIDVSIHLNPKWCRKTSSVPIDIDTWKIIKIFEYYWYCQKSKFWPPRIGPIESWARNSESAGQKTYLDTSRYYSSTHVWQNFENYYLDLGWFHFWSDTWI